MTAVEWFAQQLLSYKNPTNINGTDYISIPINKVEFLETKAKQMEKEQQERMYSEEDMIDFAMFYYTHQGKATKYWGKDLFKEWYREQLKREYNTEMPNNVPYRVQNEAN